MKNKVITFFKKISLRIRRFSKILDLYGNRYNNLLIYAFFDEVNYYSYPFLFLNFLNLVVMIVDSKNEWAGIYIFTLSLIFSLGGVLKILAKIFKKIFTIFSLFF